MKDAFQRFQQILREKVGLLKLAIQRLYQRTPKPSFFHMTQLDFQRQVTIPFLWVVAFFLAVAGGYGIKSLAKESLTIGHEDYKLTPTESLYSLNALRADALRQGASLPVTPEKNYPSEAAVTNEASNQP